MVNFLIYQIIRGEQIAYSDYSPDLLSPCQQQAPLINGTRCTNVVGDDYYYNPGILDIPGTYSHEQVDTSPCAAANNNLRLLNQQPILLCGHSEAQHAQGIQYPLEIDNFIQGAYRQL